MLSVHYLRRNLKEASVFLVNEESINISTIINKQNAALKVHNWQYFELFQLFR